MTDDWRLDNVKGLRGLRFRLKKYRRYSETWDHDHCAACMATFAEIDGPDIVHEGYATCEDYVHGPEYDWICPTCFTELREIMNWSEETGK
jgi:hypothetical protein